MQLSAFKVTQNGVDVYVGIVPARDLVGGRTRVDVWRPSNPQGYQRDLARRRITEVTHYLTKDDGVFPTTVLLSYRKPARFRAEATDGQHLFGTLQLSDKESLWVIDGQHRLAGLEDAIEQGHRELLDYPVPFSLLVNPDQFQEARWFYLVNSRQKRVPVDLAEQLLAQAIDTRGEEWLIDTEHPSDVKGEALVQQAKVLRAVDMLMERCPQWQRRIYRPGEPKPSKEAIKAHTMVASLQRGALTDPGVRRLLQNPDNFAELLHRYWCALQQTFPEAFEGGDAYSIRRTQGLYSLHMIFPDVLELCREARDYSQEEMRRILSNLSEDSDFWSRDETVGDPRTGSTSMAALRRLARHLRQQLPEISITTL
jgi:DGQHR domain-containing protein